MSRTKKHCEPLVGVWLRPSTTEPCICCKQVAEKPRGEHLKNDVCMYRKWAHIVKEKKSLSPVVFESTTSGTTAIVSHSLSVSSVFTQISAALD